MIPAVTVLALLVVVVGLDSADAGNR